MGALAPPSHWTPEDDVLLKNAVEAGASLESLAKGAVPFSRRYTIQEVQDRWYSLLYDPDVSEQASAQMILKLNNTETSKDINCSKRKRKTESIRKSYYAMRKRICNEPLDVMGPNLLSWTLNEPLPPDYMINNPGSNNLVIQVPEYDTRHSFPGILNYARDFPNDDFTPRFAAGQDCSSSEGNITLPRDHIEAPGFDPSKELSLSNFLEPQILDNELNGCSDFGGDPFRSFGIPSSLPQMPSWATSGDNSVSAPVQTGDTFILPVSDNATGSNFGLEPLMHCDSLGQLSPNTVEYIAEINNTLFDLANEDERLVMDTEGEDELLVMDTEVEDELLVMDTEVEDVLDQAYIDGLTSLLMDDADQVEVPNVDIREADVTVGGSSVGAVGVHHEEGPYYHSDRVLEAHQVESSVRGVGPDYRNGVICCTLNMEDPEIPSNDDVFLPFRFPSPPSSSGAHWRSHDTIYLVPQSVKNLSSTQKADRVVKKNEKVTRPVSQAAGSSKLPNTGSKQKVKVEPVEPKKAINTELAARISSANATANKFVATAVKTGATETVRGKKVDGPCLGKQACAAHIPQLQKNRSEVETLNKASTSAELRQTPTVPHPIDNSVLPEEEEPSCEAEFDVPYYSDVESMILDKDLSPEDFDLFTSPLVKQYQHEGSKRAIIRLEQLANACTQRAMSAQGAFAVLHGRRSRHFIKKPEVLLGRSTEDVKVDIDMGREKNSSKISRRQAMIKMDMYGVFHLKNLGKCSIYVNGKELAPGQSVCLTPCCLIEIRKVTFLFETNPTLVKQHVDSITNGSFFLEHKPSTQL